MGKYQPSHRTFWRFVRLPPCLMGSQLVRSVVFIHEHRRLSVKVWVSSEVMIVIGRFGGDNVTMPFEWLR